MEVEEGAVAYIGEKGKLCLIGKLLVDRIVGKDVLKSTLRRGWKLMGTSNFRVLWEKLFVIEFEYEWDKARLMEGRP